MTRFLTRFLSWWKNVFTTHRWALNPFQMYDLSLLLAVATTQVILGASPGSVQENLDRQTMISLAICNIVGCFIALIGLHLKELELALWVEMWGYLCLVFVLGTYLTLLFQNQINANATYGFGLAEAFVLASIHRSIQIALYKRVRARSLKLFSEANVLRAALETIIPPQAVIGEEEPK